MKLPAAVFVLGWALVCTACGGSGSKETFYLPLGAEVRYQVGDDEAFKDPELSDDHWLSSPFWQLPREPHIRWVRSRVTLPAELPREIPDGEPLAVLFSALASHELYWDGVLIGTGGVVGEVAERETPGPIWKVHALPRDLLTPGEHVLAIRTSAWNIGFGATTSSYSLGFGELRNLEARILRGALVPLLALGALVLAGLYFLTLFAFDRRERSHLWISLLSLAVAAQLVVEVSRSLSPYSYDLHVLRLRWIAGLAWLSGAFLVRFLTVRFRVRKGGFLLAGYLFLAALVAFGAPGYDAKTGLSFLVALVFALGLSGWALSRQLAGAGLALAGVAICLTMMLAVPELFLDFTLFYGIALLLLCLLFAHARQMRQQRQEHEAALLSSMRLELELLKKHLSPHFLMNSLNTLSELFEEHPKQAGEALEALAEELRGLQEIASERLIPVDKELQLCRAHLLLMGFRREQTFDLQTRGVDPSSRIPPAMFHTLLENALSHNRYEARVVGFRLQQHREGNRSRFVFEAPRGDQDVPEGGLGIGLKYVRARLREAFGDDWELTFDGREGLWRTEINIPAERAGSKP